MGTYPRKEATKNRFQKVQLLGMEGFQMSSATLSQLTNKGMKSQDPMVILFIFWGILRSHNL